MSTLPRGEVQVVVPLVSLGDQWRGDGGDLLIETISRLQFAPDESFAVYAGRDASHKLH